MWFWCRTAAAQGNSLPLWTFCPSQLLLIVGERLLARAAVELGPLNARSHWKGLSLSAQVPQGETQHLKPLPLWREHLPAVAAQPLCFLPLFQDYVLHFNPTPCVCPDTPQLLIWLWSFCYTLPPWVCSPLLFQPAPPRFLLQSISCPRWALRPAAPHEFEKEGPFLSLLLAEPPLPCGETAEFTPQRPLQLRGNHCTYPAWLGSNSAPADCGHNYTKGESA